MRVLFVTNQIDVGGIEQNIVRLAAEFRRRGHEVFVLTAGGTLEADLVRERATHIRLSGRSGVPGVIADGRILTRTVRDLRPDVVHIFSARAAVIQFIAKWFLRAPRRVPIVASVMGLQNSPTESKSLIFLRAYATSIGVRRLVVIAPAIGDVLARLPVRRSKLVELPVVGVDVPPLPVEGRDEVRSELEVPAGHPVVMTIGRLAERKSHDLFITAAHKVLQQTPNVAFRIVGSGPLFEQHRSLIERLGVGNEVRLVPERTDVYRLLSAVDVYVRPGVVEGFVGITVLEAQAVAVPVISFETEDVKLAIDDGVNGFLVRSGDTDDLARKTLELLEDPEARRRIGEEGRRTVVERFSIQAVTQGLLDLYEQVRREVHGADTGVVG